MNIENPEQGITPPGMKRIKLLGNNVLLQPLQKTTLSPGGIIIKPRPDFMDEDRQWLVAATGPGKLVRNKRTKVETLVPIEVTRGDRVLVDLTRGDKTRLLDGRMIVDADQITVKW